MRAEQTLREELSRARPGFAFLMEESGASGSRRLGMALGGRSARRHHQLPARHSALGDQRRPREAPTCRTAAAELVAGVIYNPAVDEMFWAEKGVGRLPERPAAARLRPQGPERGGVRHRHPLRRRAAQGARVQPASLARLMPQVAGVRRFGSAALDLAWVAAGRYDGYLGARHQALGHGRRPGDGARSRRLRHRSGGRRRRARPATWSPATRICTQSCAPSSWTECSCLRTPRRPRNRLFPSGTNDIAEKTQAGRRRWPVCTKPGRTSDSLRNGRRSASFASHACLPSPDVCNGAAVCPGPGAGHD